MGMFDILYDHRLCCPFCGDFLGLEIQTKAFECTMAHLYIHYGTEGDCIFHARCARSDTLRIVRATGMCRSPICFTVRRIQDLVTLGYISGFGRLFGLEYPVHANIVCGPGVIQVAEQSYSLSRAFQEFEDKLAQDEHLRAAFAPTLETAGGDIGLAILMFRHSPTRKRESNGPGS